MEKKGQFMLIAGIVVLVVSLIVILIFIFRLKLGSTSSSEICHVSVVRQAELTKWAGMNLQCTTDYVCISGGGKCDNMTASITVTVDPNHKDEIFKAIADQLADCWYTFGEGNLDYIAYSPAGTRTCGVCSIIGFDNTIQASKAFPTLQSCLSYYQDTVGGSQICSSLFPSDPSANPPIRTFSYRELINYLANTQKSDAQTYLQYLYGVSLDSFIVDPAVSPFYNSGITISTSSQYAIITGRADGPIFNLFGSGTKDVLLPVFLKTTDVSRYLGSECTSYFTQA